MLEDKCEGCHANLFSAHPSDPDLVVHHPDCEYHPKLQALNNIANFLQAIEHQLKEILCFLTSRN